MSELGLRVAPRRRAELRKIAESLWAKMGITGDQFPVVDFADVLLSSALPERYTFAVVEKDLMGPSHGLTDPDQQVMLIREDVYDGACEGCGRDRFTVAHELAHLILHSGTYLARTDPNALNSRTHQKYEDSEWQANAFASELLMPVRLVKDCSTPEELAARAGVSQSAAGVRFKVLQQEGVL